MDDKKCLILLDGYSTLYKAYEGLAQPLTTSKGEPTGAILGFLNTFNRLKAEFGFEHVAVVFDPPKKTFRSALFPEYKAHRPPMPDDLRRQDARVRQLLAAMKVPVVVVDGYEADDAMAALAIRATEAGGEALVISPDKDLLQVVRPGIKVLRENQGKRELLDSDGVIAKLGIRPDQVAAYLGLIGDTADNIPGVPKIGPKTAVNLLAEFGTIEALLAAEPPFKTKLNKSQAENIITHRDNARLSAELATLNFDCVKEFDWDRFRWSITPGPELEALFRELEFSSQLSGLGGRTVEQRTVDYRIVTTREGLEAVCAKIKAAGLCAIDTETTDLDPHTARLVGISLSWEKDAAAYLPIGHDSSEPQLAIEDVRAVLGPLLLDESIAWVAHHWQFDVKILAIAGLPSIGVHGDTMLAAYLLQPDRGAGASLRLKELSLARLGIKMTEISELIGDGNDLVTMASVTIEDSGRYACQDADVTLQLHNLLDPQVADSGMYELYRRVELPLVPVLARMELEGVRIDPAHFEKLRQDLESQLGKLTDQIHEIAGRRFNINSPKQVGEILFDELKLTPLKKTKSGNSTDADTLESLRNAHPLPAKLLEFRQLEKLKGTYVDPLPRMVNAKTGRLHTSFSQTIAATGRLSSSDPNLQNIPIRTEEGRRIREGFIPRQDGWLLFSADYSQIELRILAHLSGDATLREAFAEERDVHRLTASRMFGIPETEVSKEQRDRAKVINFGIVYGVSAFRLSNEFGIPQHEAKKFIEDYFAVYSGVKKFIDDTIAQAHERGYVTTLLGRRRFLTDINSRNFTSRSQAERIAVNTPVQGTSADMIKLAMIRIDRRLREEKLQARMVLQVHDELIFDAPQQEIERLREIVPAEMRDALPLDVPIKVDVAVGNNWAEC